MNDNNKPNSNSNQSEQNPNDKGTAQSVEATIEDYVNRVNKGERPSFEDFDEHGNPKVNTEAEGGEGSNKKPNTNSTEDRLYKLALKQRRVELENKALQKKMREQEETFKEKQARLAELDDVVSGDAQKQLQFLRKHMKLDADRFSQWSESILKEGTEEEKTDLQKLTERLAAIELERAEEKKAQEAKGKEARTRQYQEQEKQSLAELKKMTASDPDRWELIHSQGKEIMILDKVYEYVDKYGELEEGVEADIADAVEQMLETTIATNIASSAKGKKFRELLAKHFHLEDLVSDDIYETEDDSNDNDGHSERTSTTSTNKSSNDRAVNSSRQPSSSVRISPNNHKQRTPEEADEAIRDGIAKTLSRVWREHHATKN